MRAALISLGSTSSKWVAQAMEKYFDEVDMIHLKSIEVTMGPKGIEVLYEGKPFGDYDCVYAKGSFRYATLLRGVTTALQGKTYMPIRADSFTTVHDKLLTQLELENQNIPMPLTYLTATPLAAKKILEKLQYPVIMKFPHGTQGKGVMFADSYPSATSMLDALSALRQPFLIQDYVETNGTDTRAIVVGDKVVAAMQRKAADGEKRANIHAGGLAESCKLDAHAKKIAINAARALGAEICGIDMLEGLKGPVIIEANLSPGLQGITQSTGVDVADKIAKYLYEQTMRSRKAGVEEKASIIFKDLGIAGETKSNEFVSVLDFRGERILLPAFINKICGLKEDEEYIIKSEPGQVTIRKFMSGS